MNTKFPSFSSVEQTQKINELLGACESYYTVSDIFQYLPNEIEHHGKRGYLTLSHISISYIYLDQNFVTHVVAQDNMMPNKDVYDSFIGMLEFLETYKDKITINVLN
jgi:hypothetical protein